MRSVLLFLALVAPACGGGKFRIVDATEGAELEPGIFRAAVLHLGARQGQRETRESAQADVEFNAGETRELILIAKHHGAQIVITPEYGNTGNMIMGEQMDWLSTCLPSAPSDTPLYELDLPGVLPYVADYARLAAELKIWIVTGVFECEETSEGNRYYNVGLVLDDRGCMRARYRKINLWWWTESHLDEGTEATTFDSPFGRFGMLICSDALTPGLWSQLVDDAEADFLIMQSHWATSPVLGRLAMGTVAAGSNRTVLWSNHPGFLAGGAGFIHPGVYDDDAISMWSGAGIVIADLPLPERLRSSGSTSSVVSCLPAGPTR